MKKFLQEFKTFALKGNMIDLAVGMLIGSAFSGLVTSLTNNIIQPILNCFGSKDEAGTISLSIKFGKLDMPVGQFISDVINFVIMAFVVFLIVKAVNKITSLGKKPEKPKAPTTKKCPYCLSEIPIEATRCAHCTSDQPSDEKEEAAVEVEVKAESKPRKKTAKSAK